MFWAYDSTRYHVWWDTPFLVSTCLSLILSIPFILSISISFNQTSLPCCVLSVFSGQGHPLFIWIFGSKVFPLVTSAMTTGGRRSCHLLCEKNYSRNLWKQIMWNPRITFYSWKRPLCVVCLMLQCHFQEVKIVHRPVKKAPPSNNLGPGTYYKSKRSEPKT